jgi:hypothetical protein
MVLAQTNKINTTNALKDSVLAQFEQSLSCTLFKNSKHLVKVEVQKTQIEWWNHEKLSDENLDIHDLCFDWSGFRRMF